MRASVICPAIFAYGRDVRHANHSNSWQISATVIMSMSDEMNWPRGSIWTWIEKSKFYQREVELAPISKIVRQGERRLKVWFVKGTQIPTLPADKISGVHIIRQNSDTLDVAYQGTIDSALKWLAKYPVDRITTPETSLEDAFIQYYQKETGHEE